VRPFKPLDALRKNLGWRTKGFAGIGSDAELDRKYSTSQPRITGSAAKVPANTTTLTVLKDR
jgi:hypothetical protein